MYVRVQNWKFLCLAANSPKTSRNISFWWGRVEKEVIFFNFQPKDAVKSLFIHKVLFWKWSKISKVEPPSLHKKSWLRPWGGGGVALLKAQKKRILKSTEFLIYTYTFKKFFWICLSEVLCLKVVKDRLARQNLTSCGTYSTPPLVYELGLIQLQ